MSRALAVDNDLPTGLDAAASYVVVARRVDEAGEKYELIDRTRVARWVAREELARFRALVRSDKQRLLTIEPPEGCLLADGALQPAVEAGLAACARELIGPPPFPAMAAPNSGLTGLEKLARLLGDTKDKRGWLTLFPPGLPLYKGLTGLFRAIEIDGSWGALRPLFADFLEEAAVILKRRALLDAAALYRVLGDGWSRLAHAALPDVVPLLAEARTLLLARRDAFNARGADAAEEIQALDAQLETVQARARDSFPLDDRAARSLLTALSEQASLVVDAERGAVEALRIVLT